MIFVFVIILSIPVYFISKIVLKRLDIGSTNNRRHLAIIPTIIITPLLYLGIIWIWIFSVSYYPEINFNKRDWNEKKEERYKMSNNIIESEILLGKNRKEIIELLGNDFYTYNENHISYYLGFVPGLFNIDPDVLDIYFENDRVIKVEQHET